MLSGFELYPRWVPLQYVCLKMATFSFVLALRPRQNDQKRSVKKGCLN